MDPCSSDPWCSGPAAGGVKFQGWRMRISTLQDKDGRFPGACWDWRLFIHQGCSPAPNTWPQHPKLADLGFCWFCRWTTVFHVVSVLFFWFKSGWTPSYIFLSHSDFLLSSYSNALPVFLLSLSWWFSGSFVHSAWPLLAVWVRNLSSCLLPVSYLSKSCLFC